MSAYDLVWLAAIFSATAWLLRRAFAQGRGGCVGCSGGACAARPRDCGKSQPSRRGKR